jgi:hypothetical protein
MCRARGVHAARFLGGKYVGKEGIDVAVEVQTQHLHFVLHDFFLWSSLHNCSNIKEQSKFNLSYEA